MKVPVKLVLSIFVIMAIFVPCAALADEKEIVIATAPFPPYRIISSEQEVTGCDAEIVREVLKGLGYRVRYSVMPLQRAEMLMKIGKIAGFVSLTKNLDRETWLYFSDQINSVRDVFFKRKGDRITYQTFYDLNNYLIGESGYNYDQSFKDAVKNKAFKGVYTAQAENPEPLLLEMLKAGRFDLFICEINVCNYIIMNNHEKYSDIDYIKKNIGPVRPFYFTLAKQYPGTKDLMDDFNKELKNFVAKGKQNKIFKKYNIF